MKYPRYAAYKESGVEWIGEIPEHWRLLKLKYLVWCLDSKRIPLNAQERSFQEGDIEYWGANGVVGYVDKFLFNEELVLIGEDGAPFNEKFREVAFYVNKPIWPNNHIHVLKVRVGISSNFIKHSLNSCDFTNFIEGSTRDKLTQSNLLQIPIAICDTNEQKKLSSFLEAKISIIDNITSKLQKLISLLKEKRQAIISNAVTKGLDRSVWMKDSGVEWIGEIPEHWNIQKLKRIFQVLNGSTPRSDNPLYWNGNIIWVTPEDLSLTVSPVICKSSRQITTEGYDSCGTNLVPKGSIIVSTRAPIGYVKISGVELCTNQGCRSLVKKTEANENYFFYYLYCFGSVLNSLGRGSTFAELSSENLKMFQISIPPIEEQLTITQFLASETSKIDGLISKHLKLIDLLKEYKTSLITQAVTGKIDVRGFTLPTTSSDANQ